MSRSTCITLSAMLLSSPEVLSSISDEGDDRWEHVRLVDYQNRRVIDHCRDQREQPRKAC
jgi:hypothetical protein